MNVTPEQITLGLEALISLTRMVHGQIRDAQKIREFTPREIELLDQLVAERTRMPHWQPEPEFKP